MKLFVVFAFTIFLACLVNGQDVKLTGHIFDPNGAVVVAAKVEARSEDKRLFSGVTNDEGKFEVALPTGLYALEISGTGFLTIQYLEYLIVKTFDGKMTMDFVLFGAKWHEPCGYSGANCLPERLLIKNYKVKYSPSLKQIREDFSDHSKKRNNK